MGVIKNTIKFKLEKELQPSRLEVIDESSLHAGHEHAGVESHFKVIIRSASLQDLTKLAAHRIINNILADELKGPVHALSICIL